jgi:hypothetical protein
MGTLARIRERGSGPGTKITFVICNSGCCCGPGFHLNVASDSNVLRIGFIMTDSSRIDNRRRARERLISILLDLSHQYGQRKEERIELSIDLSHEDLAGFVGSSRESVSLEISRLRKEGLIVSARRRLALCDLERRLALNQQ